MATEAATTMMGGDSGDSGQSGDGSLGHNKTTDEGGEVNVVTTATILPLPRPKANIGKLKKGPSWSIKRSSSGSGSSGSSSNSSLGGKSGDWNSESSGTSDSGDDNDDDDNYINNGGTFIPVLSLRKQAGTKAFNAERGRHSQLQQHQTLQSAKTGDLSGRAPYSMDDLAETVKAWSKFKSAKKPAYEQALNSLVSAFVKLCSNSNFPAAEGGVNSFGQAQIKELCVASSRRAAAQLASLVAESTPMKALAVSREPPKVSECVAVLRLVLDRHDSDDGSGCCGGGTIHTVAGLEAWKAGVAAAVSEAKLPSAIVFALDKLVEPRGRYNVHSRSFVGATPAMFIEEGSPESEDAAGEGLCSDKDSSASDSSSGGDGCGAAAVAGGDAIETQWGALAMLLSTLCKHSSAVSELIGSDALHTLFMLGVSRCSNSAAAAIQDYVVTSIIQGFVP